METEKPLSRLILGPIAQSQGAHVFHGPINVAWWHHAELKRAGFALKPASQSNSNKQGQIL